MLKVATIVGTRPEIIRLSCIIPLLDKYFEHTLIHTGQNFDYSLNEVFFNELNIRKPDFFLNASGNNAAETIANIISKVDNIFEDNAFDSVLILGDTNSALSAIAAKRRKIPIFHMEAGNRCFNQNVPEEINRKIVDGLSDINLPYSNIAKSYLELEGVHPSRIIVTGSPIYEVINKYKERILKSNILDKLGVSPSDYLLVSCHREENVDQPEKLKNIVDIINKLVKKYKKDCIFSLHPRTRQRLESHKLVIDKRVKLMEPFGYLDYVKLQLSAFVVLSDSGTITEEASILNFRAINLREEHERPEGFEEAAVMFCGLNFELINTAINILINQKTGTTRTLHIPRDYQVQNVSEKIVRIILSYTNYINKYVWRN